MPGLPWGEEALVDPDVPYIADALREGWLVRTDVDEKATPRAPDPGDPGPEVESVEGEPDEAEGEDVVPPDEK